MSKKEKESTNGNSKAETVKQEIKEFDFGDSEISEVLIKAMTLTRKRLYPDRYDKKGKLKAEWTK